MGFLIIDSSLPLYKLLINVKRTNNATVFLFTSLSGLKNDSSMKQCGSKGRGHWTSKWGEIDTNI